MTPRLRSMLAVLVCAALAVPATVTAVPSPVQSADRSPESSGRVLVRMRTPVAATGGMRAYARVSGRRMLVPKAGDWVAVEPAASETVVELAGRLAVDPAVAAVEIEHRVYPAVFPDDPLFGVQWGLHDSVDGYDIDAPEAWDDLIAHSVSTTVVVAVVDSGVDLDHPDLADNLWTSGDIPGNGIDDDANGFVDDARGWDFADSDDDPADTWDHGTHVAGIVAAQTDNGIGVASVSGPVDVIEIMPVRIFADANGGGTLEAAQGIIYAVDNGASVVNVSWGGYESDQVMQDAIDYAEERGVIVVCAAGNQAVSNEVSPFFPGAYSNENILAVAGTTRLGALAPYSNRGSTKVDLAAPGSDIRSTIVGGGYANMSGTSMATPHVSGVAALLAARYPDEWWGSWRHRVLRGVRSVLTLDGLVATGGILNLASALETMTPEGEMALASGATHTSSTTVSVDARVFGASQMRIAIEGGSFEATESFAATREVVLSSGDGTKTVSALYLGEDGASLLATDTIVLDTVAPEPSGQPQASPANHAVVLAWPPSPSEDASGYAVWVAEGPSGSFTRYTEAPVDGTTCKVSWLENGTAYRFRVVAVDHAGNESVPSAETGCVPGLQVERVAGADRYETAVALSASCFTTSPSVVIATGESFADAVTASSLAGALDAPLLLSRRTQLPPSVAEEIERLEATSAVIVGGEAAVSADVAEALEDAGLSVTREAGSDRYETAAAVARAVAAREGGSFVGEAFVVRGDQFADAVAVAPLAYGRAMPVLLVRPTSLPDPTATVADELGLTRVFVAGGEQAVSSTQVMEVLGLPYARAQGLDRYGTAAQVARLGIARGWATAHNVGVAVGYTFPDALSGGAGIGSRSGVLLLSRTEVLSPPAEQFVRDYAWDLESLEMIGGPAALGEAVAIGLALAAQ